MSFGHIQVSCSRNHQTIVNAKTFKKVSNLLFAIIKLLIINEKYS